MSPCICTKEISIFLYYLLKTSPDVIMLFNLVHYILSPINSRNNPISLNLFLILGPQQVTHAKHVSIVTNYL
jgi:hypothetical protein